MSIPAEMMAVELSAPNIFEAKKISTPTITKKGQVLVKMANAPINPSDLAFLTGNYGIKKPYPTVPGLEGSGVVVASGGGFYANYLKGKRVACVAAFDQGGSWAEYMLTEASSCIAISDKVSDEQASMSFVNPLTAVAFIDKAKKENFKAIIMDAAGSALAKMVHYQCQKAGIDFAGVVRKEDGIESLRDAFGHVWSTAHGEWKANVKEWASAYSKVLFVDAVSGGKEPFELLRQLPKSSKMLIYGRMNQTEEPAFSPVDLLFNDYTVEGFWLSNEVKNNGLLKSLKNTRKVQAMLKDGFETSIQKIVEPTDIKEAIKTYTSSMSDGKILLKF